MKKTLFVALLIGILYLPHKVKAEVPQGVLGFDNNMYYDLNGNFKCQKLMDGNCYDVNGKLVFSAPPKNQFQQPVPANLDSGYTIKTGNGIVWTDSNNNSQTCGNCIFVQTKDMSIVTLYFYQNTTATFPESIDTYINSRSNYAYHTDSSPSSLHVYRANDIWDKDPNTDFYYKIQIFDEYTGKYLDTPYSTWNILNHDIF